MNPKIYHFAERIEQNESLAPKQFEIKCSVRTQELCKYTKQNYELK